MRIEPVINGVISRSAHPYGCQAFVQRQIEHAKHAEQINDGPKRVLVIGCSSGYGLASRIAVTFGGSAADTIGVSFERGPSEKGVGTAGWYNNIFFREAAESEGRIAANLIGDAYSDDMKHKAIELVKTKFAEGKVDLLVYSIAAAVRPIPNSPNQFWRSAIKPIDTSVTGNAVMLDKDTWTSSTLDPASAEECEATEKVMGGDDWRVWIDTLHSAGVLAPGFRSVAFSYLGPTVTHPIYLHGTLGRAKANLHHAGHRINQKVAAAVGGSAYVVVCKALVTKASVCIPSFIPYLIALYHTMKQQRTHEGCIEQMQRLYSTKLYGQPTVPVDDDRFIRIDELELDPNVQAKVDELMSRMTANNFMDIGDYSGVKREFMELNGFGFDKVDYGRDISVEELKKMEP